MEEEPEQFELTKHLADNVWLARRIADDEEYLARRVDHFDDYYDARKYVGMGYMTRRQRQVKGQFELVYEHNLGRTLSYILNHENVVSLAGHLRQRPLNVRDARQDTEDYLLWDNCDAGNLEVLLVDKDEDDQQQSRKSFMPESLCWHVLTAVMRAFVWIHDGYRQEINWDTGDHTWAQHDTDWMPILHRDIRPSTIMFQHPRGLETYGPCKLGQFGKAFVSGFPGDRFEHDPALDEDRMYNAQGYILAPHAEPVPHGLVTPEPDVQKMRIAHGQMTLESDANQILYTISDEHWALGATLFRMMTATHLPSYRRCASCEKGCRHVSLCALANTNGGNPCIVADLADPASKFHCACPNGGCEHVRAAVAERRCGHVKWALSGGCVCGEGGCVAGTPDVHIDEDLASRDYSKLLIRAVRLLFDWDVDNVRPARGSIALATKIEALYKRWREETWEGREHVDVRDDARRRYLVLNGKEVPSGLCVGSLI